MIYIKLDPALHNDLGITFSGSNTTISAFLRILLSHR